MSARITSFCILICLSLSAWADVVVLRNGKTIEGEILIQNEEVVIVRDATGMRFQFPAADIERITPSEAVQADADDVPVHIETSTKKAAILLEIAGGGSFIPGETAGGAVNADLLIGSFNLASKHIFLGGGLGYRGVFAGGRSYSFLPLELAVRVPFLQSRHAPYMGASIGYGLAAKKSYKGGIAVGAEVGYRYQASDKSAIGLAFFTSFQQAQMNVTDRITTDDDYYDFAHFAGRNIVMTGLKFAVYF